MSPGTSQRRYVAYYRVSTDRQGRSGLGLDAQKASVQQFLRQSAGSSLRAEFTEIQSGRDDARPQLAEALKLCKLTNSILLIAKLDRLSRNVAFLATLQQSSTKFAACDLPEANELVVHILAAVAQAERKAISERTKAALAAAKQRGVRLGNPHLKAGTKESALAASRVRAKLAGERAWELREIIEHATHEGFTTLRQIAERLNELGISTPQGARWHANSVRRIRHRIELNATAGIEGACN